MDPSVQGVISAHAPDATRSAPPSTVRRPTPAERRPGARMPALDGLRAIAVGLVVAYHAAPGAVPSGLIGVDVFFVLSGYLITRGLLRERERGRVHLGSFWRRRARRILPALVTMLLVVGTTLLVVGGDAAVRFSQQLLAGLLFVSNWSQISGGEDYFLGSSPPVLQNLWSLAVEEQFYLVWPVAVLVILWAVAPRAGSLQVRAARRAGTVTAVLAFVSLLWGEIAAITQGNSRAYMGTDTHGFGLLAGAALALWLFARSDDAAGRDRTGRGRAATARHLRAGHHHGVPGALGAAPAPLRAVLVTAASAVGITGILVIALQVPEVSAFTVASPLAVALSMLAILLARGRSPVASLLSTRPMVAVGARSYALYLWHWPLLVILRESAPGSWPAWCAPVLAICLSLLAACFSWTHVEAPILRLGFRGWWAEAQSLGPRPRRLGVVVVALPLVLATVGAAIVSPQETAAQQQIAAGSAALRDGSAGQAGAEAAPADPQADAPADRADAQGEPSTSEGDAPDDPAADGSAAGSTEGSSDAATDAPAAAADGRTLHGEDMLAVGDSVMLASAPALMDEFPGITIDAEVSRMPQQGPVILRQLAEQGRLRPVVVVGLGTNGEYGPGTLREIRDAIGPDRTLILVNAYADRSWEPAVNAEIADFARQDPRTVVADWHRAIGDAREGLGPDRIHPDRTGGELYGRSIAEAAERGSGEAR